MSYDLEKLAKKVMKERGLEPEFSKEIQEQLQSLEKPATPHSHCQDLTALLWCSIDNEDSKDLDQLTYAEERDRKFTLWVAVADVDALVNKDSPIDIHAQINTTSVYTPGKIFPMLPEKLSTDLTSLNESEERVALVVKITFNEKMDIEEEGVFEAIVHNYAKLNYNEVGAWLEGKEPIPEKVSQVKGLEAALLCQHEVAQRLEKKRHDLGALTLHVPKTEAKCCDDTIVLRDASVNYASQLIENFMIAANHAIANTLRKTKIPSLRRVVKIPKSWDRIREIAQDLKEHLPENPDSVALEKFLKKMKERDPVSFPDLSLTIVKLLGRGEYAVEDFQEKPIGHFGLALSQYTHSTAPNRRFPDLITQRQCKAYLRGKTSPYTRQDLEELATHCTQQEDAATKVERHMVKSAAALLLSKSIGNRYQGIVTGASERGTWVRIFHPPVEGKLTNGFPILDVGDRVTVILESVDVEKGFINFRKI